jgi:NADPH-dependent ferric siderophore reductase
VTTPPLVRRSPVHRADVVATAVLTPRMRRVSLRADALAGVEVRPAQDVELLLREPSGRRVKRRYTIRNERPDTREFDLDVLLHGTGPGALWGASAAVGDTVEFQGPRGKLELRAAPWHLLAGDESALPAIAAICAALPAGERAVALIEVRDAADELPIERAEVRWLHRGERPAGSPDLLAEALETLAVPAGTHGYLLGESRAMVVLRGVLEHLGVAHDAIFVKGYWNIGRPDRLAGRAPGANPASSSS